MKLKLIESASAIDKPSNWDAQFVERLLSLIEGVQPKPWGKTHLFALDQFIGRNGDSVEQNTGMYVPNEYLMDIVRKHPKDFVPCISVHPYRKNAIEELRKWGQAGVRMVSWVPSSMNIDPTSDQCVGFYNEMASHEMVLLVQCGADTTFDSPGADPSLGNPLFLRSALNHGVKVIVANCGGEGKSQDTDKPIPHPMEDNVNLFLRLMEDIQYERLLFGDISGLATFGRIDCLVHVLDNADIHRRLVYGSDYPMPAINMAVQTYWHANRGLLTEDQSSWLGEIYKFNPLVFDFVLKRTLRSSKTGNHFGIHVFKEHPMLRPGASSSYLTSTNDYISQVTADLDEKRKNFEDAGAYPLNHTTVVHDDQSEGTPMMSSTSEVSVSEFNLEDENEDGEPTDIKDTAFNSSPEPTDSGISNITPVHHPTEEELEEEVNLDD